jgi:hypothetical protein
VVIEGVRNGEAEIEQAHYDWSCCWICLSVALKLGERMKKAVFNLCVLFGIIIFIRCGQTTVTDTQDMQTKGIFAYAGDSLGISLVIPDSWRVTQSNDFFTLWSYSEERYASNPSDIFYEDDMKIEVLVPEENTSGFVDPTAFIHPEWFLSIDRAEEFDLHSTGRAVYVSGVDIDGFSANRCIALVGDYVIWFNSYGNSSNLVEQLIDIVKTLQIEASR